MKGWSVFIMFIIPQENGRAIIQKETSSHKKKKVGKSTFSHPPLRQRQFPHVSICFNTRYLNGSFGFNSLLTSSGPVTPQLGSINLERPSWIHSTKQSHLDLWNPVEGALSWKHFPDLSICKYLSLMYSLSHHVSSLDIISIIYLCNQTIIHACTHSYSLFC